MAGGVNLEEHNELSIAGMVGAQVDTDLAIYYIVMAVLNGLAQDFGKANKLMTEFKKLRLPELAEVDVKREQYLMDMAQNLDKYDALIDLNSLPRAPKPRLRKKEDYVPPSKRNKQQRINR